MKTNVSIELDDHQRNKLAQMIAGKQTTKLATRAQVKALVHQHIAGLLAECNGRVSDDPVVNNDHTLGLIDPEDVILLRGKHPDYVRGWNKVKRQVRAA